MNQAITLAASPPQTALSHLAFYGLAAILDEAGYRDLRLSWTLGMDARPQLSASGLSWEAAGSAVLDHASARACPDSWLHETITFNGKNVALMSPRQGKLADDAWPELQERRHQVLDTLTGQRTDLDLRLIAALGEPCYWKFNASKQLQQDDAASRWDMQPRNSGAELITNRLRPLADILSKRTSSEIVDGLTGRTVVDTLGSNKSHSRTATGFREPGPTDNALAWCALWGISQLALGHQPPHGSATTGHYGSMRAGTYYLPAWTQPWTLRRLRRVLVLSELRLFAETVDDQDRELTHRDVGKRLARRGVDSVVCFPIDRFGSASAPERRAQHGAFHTTQPGQ